MRTIIKAFLIVLITGTAAVAQQRMGQENEGLTRIHAAKMAYIADRLRLRPEQSPGFVAVYNEYEREIRATRQAYMGKYTNGRSPNPDDAGSMKYIDDNLDYQQAVIDLKRKYNDHFLKIISPQQLAELYKAERDFRQILLKQLNKRKGGRFR